MRTASFLLRALVIFVSTVAGVTAPAISPLLNVNFGHVESVKVGPAATGISETDFWNQYSFPFANFGSITNLQKSDRTSTKIGLTAVNGPGQWYNTTGDKMYDGYLYSETDIVVTLFSVPAGTYDLFLYGHGTLDTQNTKFEVKSGGASYGFKTTTQLPAWSSLVWQENIQYVKYAVTSTGQPIVITCHRDGNSQTFINGLQLLATSAPEITILKSPVSEAVLAGSDYVMNVTATGDSLSYQWRKSGTNLTESAHLSGVTSAALHIASFGPDDAGVYDVVVSNSNFQANSVPATLTLAQVLFNVNFGDATQVKLGTAATGFSTNDFWNQYSFPFANFGAVTNLKTATRQQTSAGLTVSNGPGQWVMHTGDMMYDGYIYSTGDIQTKLFNVPAGVYDLFLYGHADVDTANTLFKVTSGGRSFGSKSTVKSSAWNSLVWQKNVQYVVFEGIQIFGDALEVTASKDGYEQCFLNGLQLQFRASLPDGPPQISTQPTNLTAVETRPAALAVVAWGPGLLTYQWRHEGTNLPGATGSSLTFGATALSDAGQYQVTVTNPFGSTNSDIVTLAIQAADREPPVVTITSPTAGSHADKTFSLEGKITDNLTIKSVTWEFNGVSKGPLSLIGGNFKISNLPIALHVDNRIRVIAQDDFDNTGEAVVVFHWEAARTFALGSPASLQEGARVVVPLSLTSAGEVGGSTFRVTWDTNYLADPVFEWTDPVVAGLTAANRDLGNRFSALFALPGVAVPAGTINLANISFRARSVPANATTLVNFELLDVNSVTGDPLTVGNDSQGASVAVTKRKIKGDNNANDRLDVGDATVMMRLVAGLDPSKSWDTTGNDLNSNGALDSGDVVKVLRTVVGIDPQPVVPAGLKAMDGGAIAALGGVELVADKMKPAAGEKLTVEVRISGQTKPIAGASLRLEYPVTALRLDNSTAHQVGSMAPASGALLAWNVSPNVNDYAAQNGAISLGVSSATAWPTNNGVLARFTFTVQAAAAGRYSWPVQLKNLEISRDGFQNEVIGDASVNFIARAPAPASFDPSVHFNANGSAKLSFQGDLGATYMVFGSSDLTVWKVIGTYSTTISGAIEVTDPDATGVATRFYKATLVQ